MPPHQVIHKVYFKLTNNFWLIDIQDKYPFVPRDPKNGRIFYFLNHHVEIHWIDRHPDYCEVNCMYGPQSRLVKLCFLRSTTIDPTMWDLPVTVGRSFAVELIEDVRQRWNYQIEKRGKFFKNNDPTDAEINNNLTRFLNWP